MDQSRRLDRIKEIIKKENLPSYRIGQISDAIYKSNFTRYSQITNLPKELREQIIKELGDEILTLTKVAEDEGDNAHKVLFQTRDGQPVEAVQLSYRHRSALCLSTQSGCALGCAFCATGKLGLKKNLTADEIVDQILYFQKQGQKIDNLIFMGMGEPFANPNSFTALADIIDPAKIGLGSRHVSISTVGIVPGIARLSAEFTQVNLTFSLHSPFPAQRQELMPVTKAYPIDKVMASIDDHLQKTNHKVLIAYILLKGVNDTPDHAQALADLIKSNANRLRLLHVNLIRYNETNTTRRETFGHPTGEKFQKSDPETIEKFQAILTQNKVKSTLRQDFGVKIKAACGQLAAT